MSSDIVSARKSTAAITADAALFTAVTVAFAPLSFVVGPAAAWLLHGRRVDRSAVISWGIGLLAGVAGVRGLFAALLAIGAAIGPVGDSEFTGGIVLLVVASAVFLAMLVALDVDALLDLAVARRIHVRLDIARLVATLIVALAVVAVTVIQTTNPASGIGDAGPFALFAGAIGAVTMWVGNMMHARLEKSDGAPGTVSNN